MRMRWKLLGLAGVAGVTASGAVVVRRRRGQQEYAPQDLRAKLHDRLAETRGTGVSTPSSEPAPEAPPAQP